MHPKKYREQQQFVGGQGGCRVGQVASGGALAYAGGCGMADSGAALGSTPVLGLGGAGRKCGGRRLGCKPRTITKHNICNLVLVFSSCVIYIELLQEIRRMESV